MKKVKNIKTEIPKTNESGETLSMTYADLGVVALNVPPQGGWTTSEMKLRLNVVDKLEKAKSEDSIELEDAEFDKLKACVAEVKWNFMHKDLVTFEDYLGAL